MPKITYYDTQNSIGTGYGDAGKVDPYAIKNAQYAKDEAMDTVQKIGNKINQEFKETALTTVELDEENKATRFIATLAEEAKKQPADKQVDWYNQQIDTYRQGLRTRITDSKVLKSVEGTLINRSLYGLSAVNENYRKTVLADSLSTLQEGDDLHMQGIYGNLNKPQQIYKSLDERKMAYAALVKSGALDAAVAQKQLSALQENTEVEYARHLINADPYTALKALNDNKQFGFLTHTRAALVDKAQAEINQLEAKKHAAAREAKFDRMQNYQLDVVQAEQSMKEFAETGVKPKDFDQLQTRIGSYGDISGSRRLYERMAERNRDISEIIKFRSTPLQEQQSYIKANEDKFLTGQMSTDEQRLFRLRKEEHDRLVGFVATGKHLDWMAGTNTYKVQPLDPNNPESINARVKAWNFAAQELGGNPNVLLGNEAKAITKMMKEGTIDDQMKVGSALAKLAGDNPDRMRSILKQIRQEDSSIGEEANLLMSGDAEGAMKMAEGRKRLQNNKARYGNTNDELERKINKEIDQFGLRVIDPTDVTRAQWTSGIKSMYVGLAGETIDTVDDTLISQAMDRYFGGRVVNVNGNKTVPFSPGDNDTIHTAMWNNLTESEILKAAGSKAYAYNGTSRREVPVSEIVSRGRLVPYEDGYVIAMPNGLKSRMNPTGEYFLVGQDGYALKLNMKAIVPDLKAKIGNNYTFQFEPLN